MHDNKENSLRLALRLKDKIIYLYRKILTRSFIYISKIRHPILHWGAEIIESNDCIIVLKKNSAYKIFKDKSQSNRAISRAHEMLKKFPDLSNLFSPISVIAKHPFTVIKSPRYTTAEPMAFNTCLAASALRRLQKHCNIKILSKKSTNFEVAIQIIEQKCFPDSYNQSKEIIAHLLKNKYRVGPCHGDFHERNIMNNNGEVVLIDFDCLTTCGIQELDAIYYYNQHTAFKNSINWMDALVRNIRELRSDKLSPIMLKKMSPSMIPGLFLLYFFNRLGQDHSLGHAEDSIAIDNTLKELLKFYYDN